jgi:hypothetical protein
MILIIRAIYGMYFEFILENSAKKTAFIIYNNQVINLLITNKMPRRNFKRKSMRSKSMRRRFGSVSTAYKAELASSQFGSLGPQGYALWPYDSNMPNPASMSSQPLYYDGSLGKYVTSYDSLVPGGLPVLGSVAAAFGRRKSRRSRRGSRKSARKGSRKSHRKSRKSHRKRSTRRH